MRCPDSARSESPSNELGWDTAIVEPACPDSGTGYDAHAIVRAAASIATRSSMVRIIRPVLTRRTSRVNLRSRFYTSSWMC
jgi:hypothetical protein